MCKADPTPDLWNVIWQYDREAEHYWRKAIYAQTDADAERYGMSWQRWDNWAAELLEVVE